MHLMATVRSGTDPRTSTTGIEALQALGAYLFLVIQAQRPMDAAARIALNDIDEVVVGRGPERSIELVHVAGVRRVIVQIQDNKMSKSHATFTRGRTGWKLKDQKSTNGTRVNGAPEEETVLGDGDVIEIGYTFFLFRDLLPSAAGAATVLDAATIAGLLPGFCSLLPALQSELENLRRIATTRVSVLLLGETGTGKEVLAREITQLSARSGHLIPVNCGAIPDGMLEGQLFGHRKGAFSGAIANRDGFIRASDGGTLFLDEIGDLPMAAQASLLRALSEGEVTRIGDERPIKVDIRVISATNKPLDEMIERREFRLDLLQRLDEHRHCLPPLRERLEDLGLMIRALLPRVTEPRSGTLSFHASALRAMFQYSWPGNVRELEKCLKDAVALAAEREDGKRIELQNLPEKVRAQRPEETVRESKEKSKWVAALMATKGNVALAARKLKVVRQTLIQRLKASGIDPNDYRPEGKKQVRG